MSITSGNTDLGDYLVSLATDTMATVKRNGLVRIWKSAELMQLRRVEMQKMVAEAQVASDWEERRRIFKRACDAEDEGRISLAIDLYESLGRTSDVNRLLARQRVIEWSMIELQHPNWNIILTLQKWQEKATRIHQMAHQSPFN